MLGTLGNQDTLCNWATMRRHLNTFAHWTSQRHGWFPSFSPHAQPLYHSRAQLAFIRRGGWAIIIIEGQRSLCRQLRTPNAK